MLSDFSHHLDKSLDNLKYSFPKSSRFASNKPLYPIYLDATLLTIHILKRKYPKSPWGLGSVSHFLSKLKTTLDRDITNNQKLMKRKKKKTLKKEFPSDLEEM